MKRLLPFWTLMISGMFAFVSCDNDNDDFGNRNPGSENVPKEILEAFNRDYNGSRAEWEVRGNYAIADLENKEQSIWYDMTTHAWGIEESEIRYASLPDAVKAAFEESEYKNWKKSDIERLRRNNSETLYVVEAELGEQEVELYYTEDGVLVHKLFDKEDDRDDYSEFFPQRPTGNITQWIKEKYPNARIVDIDKNKQGTEVEIISGRREYEIFFNSSDEWVLTKTEYEYPNVPEVVKEFVASNYAGWRIDDVESYETASRTYYQIELEGANDAEKTVYADAEGNEIGNPRYGNLK